MNAELTSWKLPSLGNINAYISAVNNMPMLTLEEELAYGRKLKLDNDLDAAKKLIMSHLRVVVSTARQYLGYGLPHEDLIQEGNLGLMKAIKKFDVDRGARLVTYAVHWIKASIHEYIIQNWRMVKIVTTKAHRKLFFNLRSLRQRLKADDENDNFTLSDEQISGIAEKLNVSQADVREMELRLNGGDIVLDHSDDDSEDFVVRPIDYLTDTSYEPTHVIETKLYELLSTEGISQAVALLNPRERHIIESRWLHLNDDNTRGKPLRELGQELGMTGERVRQLEAAALKKMKFHLLKMTENPRSFSFI